MLLPKTGLSFLLCLFAIYAFVSTAGCSSGLPSDSYGKIKVGETGSASQNLPPDVIGMSEYGCTGQHETESGACITATDSGLNCRKSSDQSVYKLCEIEVDYYVHSDLERESSIMVECEAAIKYDGRYGWMEDSELDSYRHMLYPKETQNGNFAAGFEFNRYRKVVDVKIESVGCKVVSVFEY